MKLMITYITRKKVRQEKNPILGNFFIANSIYPEDLQGLFNTITLTSVKEHASHISLPEFQVDVFRCEELSFPG